MTSLDAAHLWLGKEFLIIPIPPRSKRPVLQEWPKLEITPGTASQYFNGTSQNIGVLLGDEFGSADVDCDCPEAITAARELLPETGLIFGRQSKPSSHYFYRSDPAVRTISFSDPLADKDDEDGGMIVELRGLKKDGSIGLQTVVPPSIHPSGEAVRFEQGFDGLAANVDAGVLVTAVHRVAAAALLARRWPAKGSRHHAFLALAGVIARARWSVEDAKAFHRAIYRCLWPSPDLNASDAEVQSTFEKHSSGGAITGIPTLAGVVDKKVADTALRWLGIGEGRTLISPLAPKAPDGGESMVADVFTDAGNGQRIVARCRGKARYCHPQKTWYVYTGKRWEPDMTGEMYRIAKLSARDLYTEAGSIDDQTLRQACSAWARKSESAERLKAALFCAQSEPTVPVMPGQFDADPFLLNTRTGVVDLRTGVLREHRSEDPIRRIAPVEYDGAARSELFERFLLESTSGDINLIDFLQRAAGYSLTGSVREEVLFFVHGPAASGKSTFLEALKASFGDYTKVADFESFVHREAGGIRNDVAELEGRRFVIWIEVSDGQRLAEGLVKMLTGGDSIRARFLYQEAFEFLPTFKLWLAANHAPKVRDDDTAMWRRILRVPFEHIVPKEKRDPAVKACLRDVQESGPAILAWAVDGCIRWLKDGLRVPEVVEKATEQYRLDQDPIREFVEDRCVLCEGAWVSAAQLRAAYEAWAKETGERWTLSPKAFAERLRSKGCSRTNRKVLNSSTRGWAGVGLTTG